MAEPGASSPEIVRSEFLDAGFSRILPDNVPDHFLARKLAGGRRLSCQTIIVFSLDYEPCGCLP
jgi:hypothetical protein